jgi:glycosyltransferase involved in cell wall biosynthesis
MNAKPLKVCLICVEIFGFGKYGGFGRATRIIGRELGRRGLEIVALVPRRSQQARVEELDGMTVVGFPAADPLKFLKLAREIDADVYHSQNVSFATYLATRARPDARHVLTLRDPKSASDWAIEWWRPSISRLKVMLNCVYEESLGFNGFVKRLDGVYVAAPHLVQKAVGKFRLASPVGVLPTPIEIPRHDIVKADRPTVVFVGRLDRRKRPEKYLELAGMFPDVNFLAVGKSNDAGWESRLRARFSEQSNLTFEGFVDQFASRRLEQILEKSWVIVNTAAREGISTATLEGLAHQCAVLSKVNSEKEAQNFGYHAERDDFATGLHRLLEDGSWREKGIQGQRWVAENFEIGMSIDRHIEAYGQSRST